MLFAYTIGYVGGFAGLMRAPMQLAIVCLMAVLRGCSSSWRPMGCARAPGSRPRRCGCAAWLRTWSVPPPRPPSAPTMSRHVCARTSTRVSASAVAAHGQLVSVRETLTGETERLNDAAAQAQHTARAVGDTLSRERETLAGLFAELRIGGDKIAEGVETPEPAGGRRVRPRPQPAAGAEATLASGAERLAAASTDAGSAAREAGDGLTRQAERLDVAAAALSERLRFLEARLNEQRGALAGLVQTLEHDQDDLAARLETRRAQLVDAAAEARTGASELGSASSQGVDALRGLVATATEQTRELASTLRAEQGVIREEAAEARREAQTELHRALDAMARAGEDARRAVAAEAEQTAGATDVRLASARAEVEQLGELAFAAAQRADQAFQARLGDARRMIEQTAALVEEAGQRAGQRIESGLGASRGALGDLAGALGDVEGQLARLPDAARQQAEAVRAAVEQSLQGAHRRGEARSRRDPGHRRRLPGPHPPQLRDAERGGASDGPGGRRGGLRPRPRAASRRGHGPAASGHRAGVGGHPARALGALPLAASEAVRVEAAWPEFPPAPERKPSFAAPRPARTAVFGRAAAKEIETASDSGPADALFEPAEVISAEVARNDGPVAEAPGLRPRLKFTPTPADEALKAVFAPSPGRTEPEGATGAREPPGRGSGAPTSTNGRGRTCSPPSPTARPTAMRWPN